MACNSPILGGSKHFGKKTKGQKILVFKKGFLVEMKNCIITV